MKLKLLVALLIAILTFSKVNADQGNADVSFYTGTFDVIDKEGDDQTTLFGIEHKNPNLFRNTLLKGTLIHLYLSGGFLYVILFIIFNITTFSLNCFLQN